jgi:hypothetical protein
MARRLPDDAWGLMKTLQSQWTDNVLKYPSDAPASLLKAMEATFFSGAAATLDILKEAYDHGEVAVASRLSKEIAAHTITMEDAMLKRAGVRLAKRE